MKTGVVLFNLGGPKNLPAVRGFLFNLFSDRAIIDAPPPIRLPLALLISTLRNKKAQAIYWAIGGGSPLLARTEVQKKALQEKLGDEFKVVIAMRYAPPRAKAAMQELKDWGAERVVFLPMYPQYSTATTQSSFEEAKKALFKALNLQPLLINDYPTLPGFVEASAGLIAQAYMKLSSQAKDKNLPAPRLLLSAHGLPERIIAAGDPYADHCRQSAEAIVKALNIHGLDWKLSYQSRVGPLEWIKPYTEDEIKQAGKEGKPLLIAPLAFTADNSETVYEIDQLYRDEAKTYGCPLFASTPCVGAHPAFIEGLAGLVRQALS